MPNVMMTLGDIVFMVDTLAYESFTRTAEYRWPLQERVLHRPTAQWVGIGKDTWQFDGVIRALFNRNGIYPGTYQLRTVRALAEQGIELPLTDGRGNFFGMWCIITVEEKASFFADHGGPAKQEFSITIVRQGESTNDAAAAGQ